MTTPQNETRGVKETIYRQQVPVGVRRSAWWLYNHELTRTDPETGQLYTPEQAFDNVLAWIAEQRIMLDRARSRPTPLQLRMLQLLVEGCSQKQIALQMGHQEINTRKHMQSIRERMGVDTLLQAVALAVKRGWVRVPTQPTDRPKDSPG